MRCKNCGWPNKPGEGSCSKCGSPLIEDSTTGSQPSINPNQTVIESDIFGHGHVQPNTCPKCGYPLRSAMSQCPNCNFNLSGTSSDSHPTDKSRHIRRPTIVSGGPNFRGTVNVWTDGGLLIPSFTLSPVKRNGEKKDLSDIEFEGETNILNRDNTDPSNLSITSREQANIYRKEDKWYIEDKSDQKTTFVQASRPHELHDGDIILLGNRLFVFHE